MTDSSDFDALAADLLSDPDRDVTVDDTSLLVHGHEFARLDGDALLVRLPTARAADLIERGVATGASTDSTDTAVWVSITDHEDWPELAGEAHTLAHGHLPGGAS